MSGQDDSQPTERTGRSMSAVRALGGASNFVSAIVVALVATGLVLGLVFGLGGRNNPSPVRPAPTPGAGATPGR